MKYLTVTDLKRFQHYTKRRPPWVKLHAEFLDNYEFLALPDPSKAHLMLLWLVASQLDNHIPYDLKFLSKKLGTTRPLRHSDIQALVEHRFIEVIEEQAAISPLSNCQQPESPPLSNRYQRAMPETEAEREEEKEEKTKKEIEAEGKKKPLNSENEWGEPSLNSSRSHNRPSIHTVDVIYGDAKQARLNRIVQRYKTPEALIKAEQALEVSMDDVKAILNAQ